MRKRVSGLSEYLMKLNKITMKKSATIAIQSIDLEILPIFKSTKFVSTTMEKNVIGQIEIFINEYFTMFGVLPQRSHSFGLSSYNKELEMSARFTIECYISVASKNSRDYTMMMYLIPEEVSKDIASVDYNNIKKMASL